MVGPPPVGTIETIEPAHRLAHPRPLAAHPYRVFPIADQIAEKVCATMYDKYPSGRRSSRVKDLVDLPADIQLLTAGHTILDTDLVNHLGLDTVGAISIQRTGKGCDATIFIDTTVIPELRLAVCRWAADAIDSFTDSSADELATTGWTRSQRGRWQRLCRQV